MQTKSSKPCGSKENLIHVLMLSGYIFIIYHTVFEFHWFIKVLNMNEEFFLGGGRGARGIKLVESM